MSVTVHNALPNAMRSLPIALHALVERMAVQLAADQRAAVSTDVAGGELVAAGVYWATHETSTYAAAAKSVRTAIPSVIQDVLPSSLRDVFPQALESVFPRSLAEVLPQSLAEVLPSTITGLSYPVDLRILPEVAVPDGMIAVVSNASAHAAIQEFVVPGGASWYDTLADGHYLSLLDTFAEEWEDLL
jgi:hypothetical protein